MDSSLLAPRLLPLMVKSVFKNLEKGSIKLRHKTLVNHVSYLSELAFFSEAGSWVFTDLYGYLS